MLMDNGICPTDTHKLIESADDCEMAATEVLDNDRYFKFKVINNKKNPKGCFNKGKRLYFNQKGKTTSKNTKKKAICCSIKDNKRASFGSAVQHKSAAAPSAAVAGGASSPSDGDSAGAGASSVATAAAGIVAALLVVGALVIVVVNKRQTSATAAAAPQGRSFRQRASALDVAGGAADHQLEEVGIAIPEDAAVDGLERADSYHDAQHDVVAYDTANPSDFAAAQFVLDAAAQGSLKIKSVRRPNPAYRSSAFIETSDIEGI